MGSSARLREITLASRCSQGHATWDRIQNSILQYPLKSTIDTRKIDPSLNYTPFSPHQLPLILRAFANPPPADLAALDLAAMLSGSGAGAAAGGAGSSEAAAAGAAGSSGATASLDAALPDHIRELGYQVRNLNQIQFISV